MVFKSNKMAKALGLFFINSHYSSLWSWFSSAVFINFFGVG